MENDYICIMDKNNVCLKAIEMGYRYDENTGNIIGMKGNLITAKKMGYLYIRNNDIQLFAHQFAFYCSYGYVPKVIDHINGIKDDNRICNLRAVTNQQNSWNRTRTKGYYFNKNNKKYHTQIRANGKLIHIGYFSNEIDAKEAYINAKQEYHII